MHCRQLERIGITLCQQLILIMISAIPHRSDRMNNVTAWKPVRFGQLRLSCLAATKQTALKKQL